jgi:hypothetical protein
MTMYLVTYDLHGGATRVHIVRARHAAHAFTVALDADGLSETDLPAWARGHAHAIGGGA